MIDKIKNMLHSPESFMQTGLREKSTWLAIALLIFGCMFGHDIYMLIHNMLNNSRTTDLLITSLPAIVCYVMAWIKEK